MRPWWLDKRTYSCSLALPTTTGTFDQMAVMDNGTDLSCKLAFLTGYGSSGDAEQTFHGIRPILVCNLWKKIHNSAIALKALDDVLPSLSGLQYAFASQGSLQLLHAIESELVTHAPA